MTALAASTAGEYARLCVTLGVDADVARSAYRNLISGEAVFLAVSGKIASGKDTVAPAALAALGITDALHVFYAVPLKDELDQILSTMRTHAARHGRSDPALLILELAAAWQVTPVQAGRLVELLWAEAVVGDPTLTSRSRTPGMRSALQFLGTDVRRAVDDLYWIKRTLPAAIEQLARGRSVFLTDARFENEASWARRAGALLVRLDVSAATQSARLSGRDGLPVDPKALQHPSETSLDDFDGFDLRVSNDGALADTVTAVAQALRSRATQAA